MKMDAELVKGFQKHLKSQGRSTATIESYGRDASQFIEFINNSGQVDETFDPQTLVSFQDHIKNVKESSTNTLRRLTISVRQFCRYVSKEHAMPNSPYDFIAIPDREEGIPEEDVLYQIATVIQQSSRNSDSVIRSRNTAILCLLGHEGLKTNELIELKWKHVFLREKAASSLSINGLRHRAIELDIHTSHCLRLYKSYHDKLDTADLAAVGSQFVFKAFKGREGSTVLPKMSRHGLKFILYEIGKKYGFDHLNADLLRHHSIFHQLTELGKTPTEVMNHLGLKRMGLIGKYNRLNRSLRDPVDEHSNRYDA